MHRLCAGWAHSSCSPGCDTGTPSPAPNMRSEDFFMCSYSQCFPQIIRLTQLKCDGAFIAIGHKPNTAFLSGQVPNCAVLFSQE